MLGQKASLRACEKKRMLTRNPLTNKAGVCYIKNNWGAMPSNGKRETWMAFMTYGSLGLEMGVSVAIGIAIGYYLDSKFQTSPILTLVFLVFGLIAGMKRLYTLWKKMAKEDNERSDDTRD
jgi:ATP synthase protein I